MELRETQLGAEDCERVLVCFFVAVVFEVFPRTKQVDKIVQSTVLEMEDLLSVCEIIISCVWKQLGNSLTHSQIQA